MGRARAFLLVAATVLTAAGAIWIYRARSVDSRPAAPPPPSSAASAPVDMRVLAREVSRYHAAALGPNPDEKQVEAFLTRLEAHARRKRQVSVLEVEPGLDAIEALRPRLGAQSVEVKSGLFTNYMTRLSAELRRGGQKPRLEPLNQLAGQLARAAGESQKQAAVREYLRAVETLPKAGPTSPHAAIETVVPVERSDLGQ